MNKKFDLSLSKSLVSRWENGRAIPDTVHVIALAKFFDVTLEYLLGLSDKPQSLGAKETYTREEKRLVEAYRGSSDEIQRAVKSVLQIK